MLFSFGQNRVTIDSSQTTEESKMQKFKLISEGDGVDFREGELEQSDNFVADLAEAGYLEELSMEEALSKFRELLNTEWMGEEELTELEQGIEKVRSQQGKYFAGSDGECDVMFVVTYE